MAQDQSNPYGGTADAVSSLAAGFANYMVAKEDRKAAEASAKYAGKNAALAQQVAQMQAEAARSETKTAIYTWLPLAGIAIVGILGAVFILKKK
jgi:hypothetical protein